MLFFLLHDVLCKKIDKLLCKLSVIVPNLPQKLQYLCFPFGSKVKLEKEVEKTEEDEE